MQTKIVVQEFKLIVAGGRDFNDYALLSKTLNELANDEYADKAVSIVSGMARGADALGHRFAMENGVAVYEFPADWNKHGKSAGYIRNKEMALFADGLLAFWDGKSKGTKHMIDTARQLHLPTIVMPYRP